MKVFSKFYILSCLDNSTSNTQHKNNIIGSVAFLFSFLYLTIFYFQIFSFFKSHDWHSFIIKYIIFKAYLLIKMHPVGFEPTHLAIAVLETAPLDHSGTNALLLFRSNKEESIIFKWSKDCVNKFYYKFWYLKKNILLKACVC